MCLDETEIRIEIEIEVHLWMQPALKQILKKNFWHFWMRKAKEEEKEIRGCTVKASSVLGQRAVGESNGCLT